jgi:hypothetical protein
MKITITTDNLAPTHSLGDVIEIAEADAVRLLQAGYAVAAGEAAALVVNAPPSLEEVDAPAKPNKPAKAEPAEIVTGE